MMMKKDLFIKHEED